MNGGSTLLNIVLAFVMFGVALGIKPATFVDIVKNPKSIITGIVCQLVLLPALTLLLTMIFGHWISPMIALGMILVASCPGGNISNFITSLSRGNSELSVSLTAFNTAACVITTPLNFAFWGKMYLNFAGNHGIGALPELQIPLGEIFQSIFIIMGIPLVLGILCGQYLPKVANVLKKPLQYLSIAVFIAMVVIIFTGNLDVFMACIKYIFLIVLLHNLLALGIGFGTSTLLKLPYKDRRTLTIETGIQNSGLGLILLLNPNIFPDTGAWANNGGMLVITAWWGVWHIISGLTLAFTWRIRGRKEVNED
ncbi:MAG: bile acid:sodium symporter family protein [Bacteroidales bacterium]|nr:bile acid:sodium symporter family protein [Bacteroidales bacterium]